ncbi:MAG: peptidase [Rheinheimera sp.]|uniref:M23 family metallopeptidase n=1 Tax=Arsukibacterium sp. UBA3155 TaxID=1946058 RepID=UPI000C97AA52|nr:M23 family metallopeptidase [Arsukibacterium sp. UBA3155]MAD74385.1 peptidase [Rheinheimera sp.]|tara:strand:+ start:8987 stop:9799 length:813 start_codon:yes stop_codon:yes gene_type:complete
MKVWLKALLLSCSILTSLNLQANTEVVLDGKLIQGSLIRGEVPAGSKVQFNEQPLSVTAQGQFVFGIGRDASLAHQLTVIKPDDTQHIIPLQFQARQYDIQRITGVAQKYVTPPAEVTTRIQRDNRKVRAVRNTLSKQTAIFAKPHRPAEGRISGVYGSQRVFNGEPRNPHYGLDIAAPVGAPVLAPWEGIVLLAEDLYYSGFTLIIDHGMGVSSTLMHLHAIDVVVGQHVRQGEKVAEVGATGRVTGPHLDWRINWFQERLDPQLLLVE